MSEPYIPNELLLLIADHCDLKTLSNLMQTNKVSCSLPGEWFLRGPCHGGTRVCDSLLSLGIDYSQLN